MRWRGPSAILNDKPILSSDKVYDIKCSIEKKMALSLKGIGAKTN
jgi:hypothetical protein